MSKNQYFKQPSVMNAQKKFSTVPSADINRSRFDRSSALKTTFDAGKLIPVFVDEVLPGDSFNMNATAFARLATPLKPIMDNLYLDTHFFFVPNRLLWKDFPEFMGERPTPDFDPDTVTHPTLQYTNTGSDDDFLELAQYFGLPRISQDQTAPIEAISSLPFRAYNLIWNEWYRDQNLQEPAPINIDNNIDSREDFKLLPRGKRHDYFTSALPWPQKGDPVEIPIGDEAEINLSSGYVDIPSITVSGNMSLKSNSVKPPEVDEYGVYSLSGNRTYVGTVPAQNNVPLTIQGTADLSSATAISINSLREAFQIQKLLERDARGGTRYIELILSHFGVVSDDARLQRPEYLGGGTQVVNINPVANTAGDAAPQGNLSAYATSLGNARFNKSFTEHGIIIGLVSARADLTYQQGIERMWSRKTRYDYYWPSLSHLGEQAVKNKEIYFSQDTEEDEGIFGYQERYAEYRYKPSRITGKFNSLDAQSLDPWHLSQEFANLPKLNEEFITENPPISRVVAVPAEPDFLADFWFNLRCDRPMPIYAIPGFIDHF